ncbi:MAG: hypothetical protein WC119_01155 [Synergistaceae bacterium]
MAYKLSKKIFGTKNFQTISQFEADSPIADCCWVDGLGLVYSSGQILGLISPDGTDTSPWKGKCCSKKVLKGTAPVFGSLYGLHYHPILKTIFVTEDGGRSVRAIDIDNNYTTPMINGKVKLDLERLLSKSPFDSPSYVYAVGKNKFYLLISSIKKCFYFDGNSLEHIAGDGKCRYSIGNRATATSIGMPSGLTGYKDRIYMADSFKNVIREFKGSNLSLFWGHPNRSDIEIPFKILVQKNILYTACRNGIYSCIFGSEKENKEPLYNSRNIVGIASDEKNSLYIVEEENA